MSSRPITDEEAVAAADKEMEERANRAKELLSRRYVGLKRQQVCSDCWYLSIIGDTLRVFCTDLFFLHVFGFNRRPAKDVKCSSNAR